MLREEYRRQMDRIVPDELLVARTEAAMRGRVSNKWGRRGPLRVVLVAALVLTLLTGIAFASGLLESMFLQMKDYYEGEVVDFELVHQEAAQDVFQQDITFPGTDEPMRFSIKESYYDGESLMLTFAYTTPHRPANFDFGPGHPYFSQLHELGGLVFDIRENLTAEEYQQYVNELKEHGKAGVILYQTYMSDGIQSERGEQISIGRDVREGTDDGAQWRMFESEAPLPEELRNQNEIGIQFKVVQGTVYYYEDDTGAYIDFAFNEREVVPLTARIKKGDVSARHLAGASDHGNYSVRVDAVVAPAYVKATFALDVPSKWSEEADKQAFFTPGESPVDFVCGFMLVGAETEENSHMNFVSNDLTEMSGTYPPLPEGADNLVFRPVYVISGPHPEEDIVIPLAP